MEVIMDITIETLQQHIEDRRRSALHIERAELGNGFFIETEGAMLFLVHQDRPADRAICGYVDTWHDKRWCLRREWYIELLSTFGTLPANVAVEGDEE
jgi:hypothetical protein